MGKFVRLTRFVIKCQFCGKKTDCMAADKLSAGKQFAERGWLVAGLTKDAITCKKCFKILQEKEKEK